MIPDETITVIVNWNLKQDTLECLHSLFAAGAQPGSIVVVDNASSDGSVEAIEAEFGSRVIQLRSSENLGFTGGNNIGIEAALEMGAAWILLLNNDTVVAPDFFAVFQENAERWDGFDILGPAIYYFEVPKTIWFLGEKRVGSSLLTRGLYKNQPIPASLPAVVPVDFVSGCGMLVRRAVFEQVGLFDTSLFMYGEEVDFIWRARARGFQSAVVPKAQMWHKVSASTSPDHPQTRYLKLRNQVRFYRTYSTAVWRPILDLFVIVRTGWISLKDVLNGRRGLIRPAWQGVLDGWRQVSGKPEL